MFGYKIFENNLMVVDGEPYFVQRSWGERLFTRPWRPMKSKRMIIPKIPDPDVVFIADMIVGHPVTIYKLMQLSQINQELPF